MLKTASLFLAWCLAMALPVGCARAKVDPGAGREPAAKLVKTEPVRQDTVHRTVDVVGTLAAEDQVTISSQAEGNVRRVLADLGDRVTAGQTLVEIDREKLQYTLDEQKAAHARALTKYGASESGQLPPVEETADVRKAAAELAQARQGHERATQLHQRTLISQQALDDVETTLRLKAASYDAALQNARNQRADVDASDAAMKLADRQLRDTEIRAPFDGYVQKRMVSVGELVKEQMPVMTVVRVDPLKLLAEIPERMAPWIKVGQSLDLQVDAFPGTPFAATVSRISPAVNTQTRTFAFEALAPNAGARLKPGTFARVHLETALVEQVLTVPYAAMQYRYGVYRVFTVDGDHLTAHELKTGDRAGDRMEILSGVKLGDLVVLTDVDNLVDGMKVAVNGETE
ncbi:MAG: efflux RND transporter periplasmic adaptor subunit [Acidobacteriota bacterium]